MVDLTSYNSIEKYLGNLQSKASPDQVYLISKTKLSDKILDKIPNATVISSDDVIKSDFTIVEWNFANSQILADLGVASVSPIMRDYDFSGELTPFKHQYIISSFLACNKHAFCLADMGTGKTLSIIHAINYLLQIGEIKKVLIVCPLSVMRDAWEYTIPIVKGNLTCDVIYWSNKERRIQILEKSTAPIHIINPDGIEVINLELLRQKYDLVVIDELTTYKTPTTVRWKFLNKITVSCRYIWGITGTPVPNSPNDAYGQIKMVSPNNLNNISYNSFKEMVSREANLRIINNLEAFSYKYSPESSLDIVYNYFNPAIRVRKEDCLDLPDVINIYRHCKLSRGQEQAFKDIRNRGLLRLRSGQQVTAQNGASYIMKLLQIVSGTVYDDQHQPVEIDYQSRIKETISLITEVLAERTESNKGKTLVFVQFRAALDRIHRDLSKHFKVAKINSDVNDKQRQDILNKLQNTDEVEVIVAIPTTMSHGITATSASLIVWFAPLYSCETYLQACNRINRAGQTQKMTIAHLYGSSLEMKIYNALQEKHLTQSSLLSYYKEFIDGK